MVIAAVYGEVDLCSPRDFQVASMLLQSDRSVYKKADTPASDPRETSQTIIVQAMQLKVRDEDRHKSTIFNDK